MCLYIHILQLQYSMTNIAYYRIACPPPSAAGR